MAWGIFTPDDSLELLALVGQSQVLLQAPERRHQVLLSLTETTLCRWPEMVPQDPKPGKPL